MIIRTPAKINLHLRVGGVEADGYHALRTWMVTVGLFDRLSFEFVAGVESPVTVWCGDPNLVCDRTNLVHRAATLLISAARCCDHHPAAEGLPLRTPPGGWSLRADLAKHIPIGGGLGGGSSDAAATLVAVDRMLKLGSPMPTLHALASTLGSDVPFFLHAPSAVASGRGEVVAKCPKPRAKAALLILPPINLSTPLVYRKLDELRPEPTGETLKPFDIEQWSTLKAGPLLDNLANDLEAPAFAIDPRLGRLKEQLERKLGRPVRLSGSGSALFTLYDELDEASAVTRLVGQTFSVRTEAVEIATARITSDDASMQL